MHSRRLFLERALLGAAASAILPSVSAQDHGARPPAKPADVEVLNPRGRVPVGLIIDDSTCLVNLNKFAMPQFDETFAGQNPSYKQPWRDWPNEIPDRFTRKFAAWAAEAGVRGKWSVVPFPACVGRMDRMIPGWSNRELRESLDMVREVIVPNFDIHPEMLTHTRVIDLRTGHPYPNPRPEFMENWAWTTGKSADEIGAYMEYALNILKNAGLTCEGLTTPGGFGSKARPQLAQGSFQSLRSVFKAEIPHYFRDLYDKGDASVAPRVELAAGLDGDDPQCVVSVVACTGDWTGGWDNTLPVGADRFITADGQAGRMVDVIQRGEPAMILGHWTGIYFNGQELGLQILQEVTRRLHARFDNLIWMKLAELSRYWAAKELTTVGRDGNAITFRAPFACPDFTVKTKAITGVPSVKQGTEVVSLREVAGPRQLVSGTWCREGEQLTVCFALRKGASSLSIA
jgi:hypothetical protein